MYPQEMIKPLEEELTSHNFEALKTPEAVDAFLTKQELSIVVINSVCGCAASVRPGVIESLEADATPVNLGTVFAGGDVDAVQHLRDLITEYPPSSPAVAVFKEGKIVAMLSRQDILGKGPHEISDTLKEMYVEYA